MIQIKMAYCLPDRLVELTDESGRTVLARKPQSPTRSARVTDVATWWEDLTEAEEFVLDMMPPTPDQCILREVPHAS